MLNKLRDAEIKLSQLLTKNNELISLVSDVNEMNKLSMSASNYEQEENDFTGDRF